jgi:hypothetical protein
MDQVVPFPSMLAACPDQTTLLDTAERAFLAAARCWVSGYRTDKDPMPRILRDLRNAGARGAAFPLNSFMAIVADTGRLPIPIQRPQCLDFSAAEQLLLFAASLAQASQIAVAERVLRRVSLSDAGAKFALEPLRECADLFAAAGLRFTRRRSPAYQPRPNTRVEYLAPPAQTLH